MLCIVCMYVFHMHTWYLRRSEEGQKWCYTWLGITMGKLAIKPRGPPPQEQKVLLITEPTLLNQGDTFKEPVLDTHKERKVKLEPMGAHSTNLLYDTKVI